MHFKPKSSAYLENVWVWVADHDLDIPSQDQIVSANVSVFGSQC
jgi:hypothetical protein